MLHREYMPVSSKVVPLILSQGIWFQLEKIQTFHNISVSHWCTACGLPKEMMLSAHFQFCWTQYWHFIKVYKLSVHLHSDIHRWMVLFPPEESLAHTTALWQFFVVLSTCDTLLGPGKNCFMELLPTWKRTVLVFVIVLAIIASNKMYHHPQS